METDGMLLSTHAHTPRGLVAVAPETRRQQQMNYEVDFLPVGEGSGDAIVIRYGDDTGGYLLYVVDGGPHRNG